MKIKSRPFVGTIVKPKLGLKTKDHTETASQAWLGGCDIVKDDENLSSQDFNKFEKRLVACLESADKAKSQTGEEKGYLINVTAETRDMIKRAQLVEQQGGKYIMVDIVTSGFAAVQTLREADFKMAIHAHRAMHAAFTRTEKHGISMMVLADFARLICLYQLHIGTAVGKLEGDIELVSELNDEIEKKTVKETKKRLSQNWGKIKPVLSVSSGGLHPGHIPYLVKHLGKDLVLQFGGGIHGHLKGTLRGAIAARQALDATLRNISLKKYAKKNMELPIDPVIADIVTRDIEKITKLKDNYREESVLSTSEVIGPIVTRDIETHYDTNKNL
jgi:ribulose-bisphosphate carboxylase large chain